MKGTRTLRACPVCNNQGTSKYLHTQYFLLTNNHPLPENYDIVSCQDCGTVYADSPVNQSAYDKYYEEMSRYDMNYTCSHSLLYVERAAWISKFINDKSYSIIDIGCGNGHLLFELKHLGFTDLTGLDPSIKCISDLKLQGINGIVSSIFSVSTNRQWECAILSGVLEHIYDVQGFISTLRNLLMPMGILFVCVPDASRYCDFDHVPYDYFNIEHINHFDETSLLNLGLQHGFSMIAMEKSTITLAQTTQPIIYCAYQNTQRRKTNWQSYSRVCINEYIYQTQQESSVTYQIDYLMKTNEEIILWGAGNYTNRLLANSNLDSCNIIMIVDSDKHKQGSILSGKTVVPPDAINKHSNNSTIVIAAAVFCDEILADIRRRGLTNNIITLGKINESMT